MAVFKVLRLNQKKRKALLSGTLETSKIDVNWFFHNHSSQVRFSLVLSIHNPVWNSPSRVAFGIALSTTDVRLPSGWMSVNSRLCTVESNCSVYVNSSRLKRRCFLSYLCMFSVIADFRNLQTSSIGFILITEKCIVHRRQKNGSEAHFLPYPVAPRAIPVSGPCSGSFLFRFSIFYHQLSLTFFINDTAMYIFFRNKVMANKVLPNGKLADCRRNWITTFSVKWLYVDCLGTA